VRGERSQVADAGRVVGGIGGDVASTRRRQQSCGEEGAMEWLGLQRDTDVSGGGGGFWRDGVSWGGVCVEMCVSPLTSTVCLNARVTPCLVIEHPFGTAVQTLSGITHLNCFIIDFFIIFDYSSYLKY
jgi:hypothetical protein